MEEKRKSFRIRRALLIRFKLSSGKQYTFNITDINESGLCFLSLVPFKEGDRVDLQLKLPNRSHEWQVCNGEVLESKDITKYPGAFVSGFRTRIKFISYPDHTAKFLKEYCDFASKHDQALERIFNKEFGILDEESEKRGSVRINKFIVTMYSESSELIPSKWDMTVIRNISTSGALFTTKIFYNNSTFLKLMIKVPLRPFDWLDFDTRVVESWKLKNMDDLLVGGAYLTRVQFVSAPVEKREALEEYIEWFVSYFKKQKNLGLE